MQYSSSGTAVLVQAKRPATSEINPLLAPNDGLTTTAYVLIQSLSAPTIPAELGLARGRESFTVKGTGSDVSLTAQPFIYVTAMSPNPERSVLIVSQVLSRVRQELTERQKDLRVTNRDAIHMTNVVDPTPPKFTPGVREAGTAVALVLGIILTVSIVCMWDRMVQRRRRRSKPGREAVSLALGGNAQAKRFQSAPQSGGNHSSPLQLP